jgi:hypothetical protein
MRRRVAVPWLLLAMVAIPTLAVAATGHHRSGTRVKVSPRAGFPQTHFVVRFKASQRTGRFGSVNHRYELGAWNVFTHTGCRSTAERYPPPSRKGATITVRLGGGNWCVGRYNGNVDLVETPVCPRYDPGCADYGVVLKLVGTLSFRVKSPIRDTKPPRFVGLKSAVACRPVPRTGGQRTNYTLTWHAARDDVTPSAQIVYDVFTSTTPGGENFAVPNDTTPPGVARFKELFLASHETIYFVVRARDEANNEDHNRVERRGVHRCVRRAGQ